MFKSKVFFALVSLIYAGSFSLKAEDAVPAKNQDSQIVVYYLANTFRCLACKTVGNIARDAVIGTPQEPGPLHLT